MSTCARVNGHCAFVSAQGKLIKGLRTEQRDPPRPMQRAPDVFKVAGSRSDRRHHPFAASHALRGKPNQDIKQSGDDKPILIGGADWCPHCQAAKKAVSGDKRFEYVPMENGKGTTSDGKKLSGARAFPTIYKPDGTKCTEGWSSKGDILKQCA